MGYATTMKFTRGNCSILLLGHGGMLWQAWATMLEHANIPYFSPSRFEFDFVRPESIRATVTQGYSLVINAAGFTNVDLCESLEGRAAIVNGSGVATLAQECKKCGATLIHYSSDHVFSGETDKPYSTDAIREPVNAYGRTKALGDDAVERSGCDYLLIRTSWLYAPWGQNFVTTIAQLASIQHSITVVDDQFGRPTCASHLASESWRLFKGGARGSYHLTDGGHCSRYEWARTIVELTNSECVVEPCATKDFPRPAKRPRFSVLDLSKTEDLLGAIPTWQASLPRTCLSIAGASQDVETESFDPVCLHRTDF